MSPVTNSLLFAATPPDKPAGPDKVRDAAQQFEALLMGQILRSARESNGSSDDAAMEFAEQHLSTVLAHSGGFGLARLIGQGLGPHKLQA